MRANYGTSFTAPALTSRGNENGVTAESSFGGVLGVTTSGVNANLTIPNTYPGAIGLPGCTAATPTCVINTAAVQGVFLAGGNKDLVAQKGKTSSFGIDFTPSECADSHRARPFGKRNTKVRSRRLRLPSPSAHRISPVCCSSIRAVCPPRTLAVDSGSAADYTAAGDPVLHLQLPAAQRVQPRR